MEQSAKSPFQMTDSRIAQFEYHNNIFFPSGDLQGQWTIRAQRHYHYVAERAQYEGSLLVDTGCKAGDGGNEAKIHCIFLSAFVFQADESEENAQRMEQLLSRNGMLQSLGVLRSALVTQSGIFRMPFPCIIPSINLNNFEFDKEYTL